MNPCKITVPGEHDRAGGSRQLIVFILDEQRYGLALSVVERVVRLVEIAPLARAPEIVRGVINFQGQVVPVLDVRRRIGLPERTTALSDHLIIARTPRRTMALTVETVLGVIECAADDWTASEQILPGLRFLRGVVKLPDGLLFIHDLDEFLSLEEEQILEEAMRRPATSQPAPIP